MTTCPIVSARRICGVLFVFALLAPAVLADTNEDPRELVSKSFQQADLWQQRPVKLVAKVRRYNSSALPQDFEYTVYWAGPERWRVEWGAAGERETAILNDGQLAYVTSRRELLWFAIELQAALAALDGGTPAGPHLLAPLAYENADLHVSTKKINGIEARCLAFGKPKTTLCIDPSSRRLLTAENEVERFEYSDYTTIGSSSYPQTVKVGLSQRTYKVEGYPHLYVTEAQVTTPIAQATVAVTRDEQFPKSLFVAPGNATTLDLGSCSAPANNFTAPHLDKSVKAKKAHAARKGYHYGSVWVLATVGKDGSVQKSTMLSGDPVLGIGATDAVQQYRYTPYIRCGKAVEFQQLVVVDFPVPAPALPPDHSNERATYPTCFPCPPH